MIKSLPHAEPTGPLGYDEDTPQAAWHGLAGLAQWVPQHYSGGEQVQDVDALTASL